jgi:hypothetical protein
MILFPLFDIGGKFDTGAVSTSLAKLVAKFAAGVVLPPVSLIPVVHLDLQISPRIFATKFETVLMGYSGAGGKHIH